MFRCFEYATLSEILPKCTLNATLLLKCSFTLCSSIYLPVSVKLFKILDSDISARGAIGIFLKFWQRDYWTCTEISCFCTKIMLHLYKDVTSVQRCTVSVQTCVTSVQRCVTYVQRYVTPVKRGVTSAPRPHTPTPLSMFTTASIHSRKVLAKQHSRSPNLVHGNYCWLPDSFADSIYWWYRGVSPQITVNPRVMFTNSW